MTILDTNIVIDIFNGYEPIRNELKRFSEEELKISIFTKYEMLRGTTKENESRTREFLEAFGLCSFNNAAMEESIEIYKNLGNKVIDEIDILILGISRACGEMLITRDRNLGKLADNIIVIKA